MKLYIIAGEASGDIYGAQLMAAVRRQSPVPVTFSGIGGPKMEAAGLQSLFPMAEISLMGFWEIVPHLRQLLRRIKQTLADILAFGPDIVITIDSPGFCRQIAKGLRHEIFSLVHYVAPTVWAYKPGRAKKFARLFDHLLVILPFEPPYFDAVGLKNTYIGHPIMETVLPDSSGDFRRKYGLAATDTLLCMMPGSRMTEITRLLPIFLEAAARLPALKVAIPVVPALKSQVAAMVADSPLAPILIDNDADKFACLKTANMALVKSGTGSLEVAMAGCPMVIAYKVGFITHQIIKRLIKIKFANLINLILNRELIPEFIQERCTPELLAEGLKQLLTDDALRQTQQKEAHKVLEHMGWGQVPSPSEKAAAVVLRLAGSPN